MIPQIEAADGGSPASRLADDELLIVLGAPGHERAPWVKDLMKGAVKALTRKQHYMTTHVGFQGSGVKPYVVVDFEHAGNSPLERRWVLHKLAAEVTTRFETKKLAVFLEKGCGPTELAHAEDLLLRHTSPRYDKSLLTSGRVLAADAAALKEADPFHVERTKGHVAFRQWVNENPDELTSLALGERLQAFCKANGCAFQTFDVDALKQLGMNLLLAVGQASDRSPSRLHIATHNVKPGDRPLVLLGKGITFDTGGINLKPHESFVNCMKNDMGGAGLMINLFTSLVASGYAGPLAVVIPCCENLIDGRAMKPGAVVRAHAGKDVLIEHTDAEGRLILCDALSYLQKQLNPAVTIIAATLTTAALRQFTNFFTPIHFANAAFQQALAQSGHEWGEGYTFWGEFLPFAQGNKTNAADLTNMGRMPSHASMGGGSNVAAHFLREFAVQPIVHCDIFASTWNWSGDYPGAHYGATGAPFNSLFNCLRRVSGDSALRGYGNSARRG